MRLLLLGLFLHWKNWLPVGGLTVYSRMVKKQVSEIQPIGCYVRLTSSRSRDHHGLCFMNKERVCV